MKNFILLFLFIYIHHQEFAAGCFLNDKRIVYVHNDLPKNTPSLKLHCWSKNDDLGLHTLALGQQYSWSFCSNFFPTTLFTCQLWWGSKNNAAFDAYKEKFVRSSHYLHHWIAKTDGIYYSDYRYPSYTEKRYDWSH